MNGQMTDAECYATFEAAVQQAFMASFWLRFNNTTNEAKGRLIEADLRLEQARDEVIKFKQAVEAA